MANYVVYVYYSSGAKYAMFWGLITALTRSNFPHIVDEASGSRVLQLEKRVEEVARQANSAQIQVHEIELQLQASLASTYNGGFLWRIPDISRRRRDAVEERVMSLYSPPFYTARLV